MKNDIMKSKNKKREVNENILNLNLYLFRMHLYLLRDTFASIWTQPNYPKFLLESYKKQKNYISKVLLDFNKNMLKTKIKDINQLNYNLETYTFDDEIIKKQYSIQNIDSLFKYTLKYLKKPSNNLNTFLKVCLTSLFENIKWALNHAFKYILLYVVLWILSLIFPILTKIIPFI